MFQVWRRSSALAATQCPYCRQRITIILPYFSDSENNSADITEVETREKIKKEVHMYNRRYSGEPRSFVEQVREIYVGE